MNSVNDLTKQLSEVCAKLRAGEIDVHTAEAVANVAGKVIRANVGQLQYYAQRGDTPNLKFWEREANG